jgi:hypothetical protein
MHVRVNQPRQNQQVAGINYLPGVVGLIVLPDSYNETIMDSYICRHLAGGVDHGTASYQGIKHNGFYPLWLS